MAPCSKLRRSCMVWGSVSATTVAPRAAAALPAASWLQAPSGFMAETPSTFQLTGRSASSDMVERKSMSSSLKPLRQPATMSSTVVPSCWRTAAARRSISSRAAARDGTGWPSPSLCVCTCEVEKPSAPSASAACSAASMASMSSASAAPPTARSPMTSRRSVEWPTRKPGVHGDAAVEAADPVAEGAPVPGQPGLQRGQGHALDPRHHPRDVVDVLRRHGRQREAAVAAEHRGHAVQRGRAGVGVPEELRVVVRVQVDEARRDQHAGGVDHGVGAGAVGTGPDARRSAHPSITHVGPDRRRPGPVDDRPAADGHRHACSSLLPRARPAHPHPLAGEGLHALGPELDAEARLLPPAHRRVHVDGGHAVGVDEDRPGRQPRRHVGGQRVVVAPDRRAQAERACRSPRRPPRDVVVGDHRQGGGELLLAHDAGVGRRRHHQRRRDEVAPRSLVLGAQPARPHQHGARRGRLGEQAPRPGRVRAAVCTGPMVTPSARPSPTTSVASRPASASTVSSSRSRCT